MELFNNIKQMPGIIRNYIYKQSLQRFLFMTCIAATAIILLLSGCIVFYIMKYTVFHSIEEYYNSNHNQVRDSFFSTSKEIKDFADRFAKDENLLNLLDDYEHADIIEKYYKSPEVKNLLNNAIVFYDDIYKIEVYYKNYYFQNHYAQATKMQKDIMDSDLFNKVVNEEQAIMLSSVTDQGLDLYIPSISFVSLIRDTGGNPLGVAVIVMKDDWLNNIFGSSDNVILYGNSLIWSNRNEFYNIVDEVSKTLKYDYGIEDIYSNLHKYRIYYTKTNYNDLYIVSVMEYNFFNSQYSTAFRWLIISFIIIAILSFFISKQLANIITKPIYKLIKAMRQYGITVKANMNDKIFDSRRSFRKGIVLYYTAMIFLSVFIFICSFNFINRKIIYENITKMSTLSVNQAVNDLDYFVEMNERMSTNLAYNSLVHDYLYQNESIGNADIYNIKAEIDKFFTVINRVFDVNFYSMSGDMKFSTLLSLNTRLDNNMKEKIINYKGKAYWDLLKKDLYNRNIITQTRLIMNVKPTERIFELYNKIGFLQVAIDESALETFYRSLNHNGSSAYIIDENGIIVSHFSKQLIGMDSNLRPNNKDIYSEIANINNTQEKLFIASKSKKLPVYVVYEARLNELSLSLSNTIIPSIIILIIVLMFSALFGSRISYFVIYQLSLIQSNIFSNNSDTVELLSTSIHISEIQFMANTFNEMSKRINELIETVYKSEIKRKDLEMSVLQAQINPHFLCNTLETISSLIDNGEKEKAGDVMILLRNLFSAWVHDYNLPITVREEIKYTQSYIEIQKRRFGNMIKDEWLIDDNLIECRTLRFVIQPVIENCIHHGNPDRNTQLSINVYCFERDGIIILRVVDNGVGMSEERLNEVRSYMDDSMGENSIGLYNVNKRIKIFFGDKYGIHIDSKLGKGTIVDIIFPKEIY